MKNTIIIKKPYITQNGDLYRLNAEVIENDKTQILFCEVEKEYSEYLCSERGDAFLHLVLPVAMREKYDIICEVPITEQLLHNLREIFLPHLSKYDERLYNCKITAPTENEYLGGEAIGTAISCGVDSLYTTKMYIDGKYPSMQLTHLFIASANMELWNTKNKDLHAWVAEHKIQFDRYKIVSDELKLPLVKVYSNFFDYICARDWKIYHHLWVHLYITMSMVLSLKKLWKIYYFSGSEDYSVFNLHNTAKEATSRYELLSVYCLTTPDFFCFSGGIKTDRIEKTLALADWNIAQKTLHPCHGNDVKNCTLPTCGKCLRALLALDCFDKLDTMTQVFDIEKYKKEKYKYMWHLVHNKNNEYLSRLYKLMYEKYPKEMKIAETNHDRDVAPVPRGDFNILQDSYNLALNLIKIDNPRKFLVDIFQKQGYEKIYVSGSSRIGNQIVNLIKDDLSIFNYAMGANPKECDVCFIIDTRTKDIDSKITQLKKRGATQFLKLKDINQYILELEKLKIEGGESVI